MSDETPQGDPRSRRPRATRRTGPKSVSRLNVSEVPEGAVNINVEGRRLASPIQGFGKMWQKTYQVRLPPERVSATDLIATWKQRFPDFWPEGNSFYGPLTGIAPGEVALINMTLPGKMKLSTGVMVLYADEESFTLMTPQGHMFAGWITFSATEREGDTVAQAQVLMRASDPIFEMGLTMGGHKQEDKFWQHTLTSLAAHFGEDAEVDTQVVCVDKKRQWSKWRNVWHWSAIRSTLYTLGAPGGRSSLRSSATARLPESAQRRRRDRGGAERACSRDRPGSANARSRSSSGPKPWAAARARRRSRCPASCTTRARPSTRWRSPRRSCASCRWPSTGSSWCTPMRRSAHPRDGGSAVILNARWRRQRRPRGRTRDAYNRLKTGLLCATPGQLSPGSPGPARPPRHPLVIGRFGLSGIRSAAGLARSRFDGESARALLGGCCAHSMPPLAHADQRRVRSGLGAQRLTLSAGPVARGRPAAAWADARRHPSHLGRRVEPTGARSNHSTNCHRRGHPPRRSDPAPSPGAWTGASAAGGG